MLDLLHHRSCISLIYGHLAQTPIKPKLILFPPASATADWARYRGKSVLEMVQANHKHSNEDLEVL